VLRRGRPRASVSHTPSRRRSGGTPWPPRRAGRAPPRARAPAPPTVPAHARQRCRVRRGRGSRRRSLRPARRRSRARQRAVTDRRGVLRPAADDGSGPHDGARGASPSARLDWLSRPVPSVADRCLRLVRRRQRLSSPLVLSTSDGHDTRAVRVTDAREEISRGRSSAGGRGRHDRARAARRADVPRRRRARRRGRPSGPG